MSTTRRDLLQRAAALAATPANAHCRETCPTILFALADDRGWTLASIAGGPVVKTPVLGRVASRGVLFTNAFVGAPSCAAPAGSDCVYCSDEERRKK